MVKLMWRLSGDLIYHAFSTTTLDNLQTDFTIKSPSKKSLSTLSPYSLHTNYSGN